MLKSGNKRLLAAAILSAIIGLFCYRGYQYNKLEAEYWRITDVIEQPICMLADEPEDSDESFLDMLSYILGDWQQAADFGYAMGPNGYGYVDVDKTLDLMLTPLISRGVSISEARSLCSDYSFDANIGRLIGQSVYAQVRICMLGSIGELAASTLPLPGRVKGTRSGYPAVRGGKIEFIEERTGNRDDFTNLISYTEERLPPDFKHISRSVRCD